jgi:predicted NBD/HSP70 family sugar kinase
VRLHHGDVGQRSETAHRANLSAIVRGLHERGPQSRSELVAATGLTRSAIRTLVGELADAGLVEEDRPVRLGTPGRPSPLVRLVPTAALVLSLEILVDSIAVAIVGLGGRTLERVRIDRPRKHLSVDDVVADLHTLAGRLQARLESPIVGIGVAVAGVVRREDGLVALAPNLGWVDVPLGARLARTFAVTVPIAITNDADAGILAEHRRGAAVGVDDAFFVSGEVGVGGGAIVGGRPLNGTAGFAGEIGHMTINNDGARCRCGARGCWETEVGEGRLLEKAGYPPDAGRAAVDRLFLDAAAGSPTALAALEHVGRWLGIGIGNVVNLLNPRVVVLGGLHARTYPFVRDVLEAELAAHSLAAPRSQVRVVPAELGIDAPLVGAAELAFEPLLTDPAAWFPTRARAYQLASA